MRLKVSAIGWLGVCGVLLWCPAAFSGTAGNDEGDTSTAVGAAVGSLIPRKVLFGNPDKAAPLLSPDGKWLAYLAPDEGVLNVWAGPAQRPRDARPITRDRKRGIRNHLWAQNGTHVLYVQDRDGDENWRLYSVKVDAGETKDLTPFDGVQARLVHLSPRHPDEALIALNNRMPELHDVHRVNLVTGKLELVFENRPEHAFIDFVADDDLKLRVAQRMTPDGGFELLRTLDDGKSWEPLLRAGSEDSVTTGPLGVSRDGRTLHLVDSRDRDTSALVALPLAGGDVEVLAVNERADVADTVTHPTERTIQAVGFNYDRKQWKILDPAIQADFDYLRTVADGDFDIISRTHDDQHWLVLYEMDNGPMRFYRYDRAGKQATFLFTNRAELEQFTLARMHPFVLEARDGRKLVSYLTLPVGSYPADSSGPARPTRPLPMVLLVHGGPWARDEWGLDPLHQWLANRGYAVLSVNFRGSTGFGKKFVNDGDMQWGAAMHADLLDAVNWAVAERVADPQRIAILGGSYGGYAVLWAMTNSPEVFACGVDIVGPSNLVTLIESIPPYWKPLIEMFAKRVGDIRTPEGREFLKSRSPLTYVENIRRPLLIGQGMNDPRVKEAESLQIVNAMKERKIPVTYVVYPDEGHGFARPANSISFWAITELFLGHHLGGSIEEIGPDDYRGSSLLVQHGVEQIPGLQDSIPIRD